MSIIREILKKWRGPGETLDQFAVRMGYQGGWRDCKHLWKDDTWHSKKLTHRIIKKLEIPLPEAAWFFEVMTGRPSCYRPKELGSIWERLCWYKRPDESPDDFAMRAGVKMSTLRDIERGEYPKMGTWTRIRNNLFLTNEQMGWILAGDWFVPPERGD